jgi:hypothetical protein
MDNLNTTLPNKLKISEIQHVNLIYHNFQGDHAIELRRRFVDRASIVRIITCAFHETPIIVLPRFNNKILAISTLIEKGIIKKNSKEEYEFII